MSKRLETNWEESLKDGETGNRKEDGREVRVVLLKGLQRCAQLAGLRKSSCEFKFIPSSDNANTGIMQCVYTTEFDDGTVWVGAADCNHRNTGAKYVVYPTAVAESRAEARCLRKALNISILSSEEIGFMEGGAIQQIEASSGKAIDAQVIKAIEKLCETRNISQAELLESILSKDRNSGIFELTELTVEEGQKAMGWLNEQKPAAAPKKSKAEEREARKKELQAEQEKS